MRDLKNELIRTGIINADIHQRAGRHYTFTRDEKFTRVPMRFLKGMNMGALDSLEPFYPNLWNHVLSFLKEGQTLDEAIAAYNALVSATLRWRHTCFPVSIDDIVVATTVEPVFFNVGGIPICDSVRVCVCMRTYEYPTLEDLRTVVEIHQKELKYFAKDSAMRDSVVRAVCCANKKLKLKNCLLRKDRVLEMMYDVVNASQGDVTIAKTG